MSTRIKLEKGVNLQPIPEEDGSLPIGFAVILEVIPMENVSNIYVVMTNFGNVLQLIDKEMEEMFIPIHRESLKLRFREQIENLLKVQKKYVEDLYDGRGVIETFCDYLQNPGEGNRLRLKVEYEDIPDDKKRYVLGDQDSKDSVIKTILYGPTVPEANIKSWKKHYSYMFSYRSKNLKV